MTTKLIPILALALLAMAILSFSTLMVNLEPLIASIKVSGVDKAPIVQIPSIPTQVSIPQVEEPEVSEPIEEPQVDTRNSHAELKHGIEEAQAVRDCLAKKGALITMYFPNSNNKHAKVCMLDDGSFGIRFLKNGSTGKEREITAFIRRQAKTLDDVINYLVKSGYTQ